MGGCVMVLLYLGESLEVIYETKKHFGCMASLITYTTFINRLCQSNRPYFGCS